MLGHSNSADLPLQFIEFNWFEELAKGPDDSWLNLEVKPYESLLFSERKKRVNVSINITVSSHETKWHERFSGFSKIIRVLGWVKRFMKNCLKIHLNKEPYLSALELH